MRFQRRDSEYYKYSAIGWLVGGVLAIIAELILGDIMGIGLVMFVGAGISYALYRKKCEDEGVTEYDLEQRNEELADFAEKLSRTSLDDEPVEKKSTEESLEKDWENWYSYQSGSK